MSQKEYMIDDRRPQGWHVYIVRCKDCSYYTGITTDISRRIAEHNSSGDGAKYTRSRRPVVLVYCERITSRSIAASREYYIRKLSHAAKKKLITTNTIGQLYK